MGRITICIEGVQHYNIATIFFNACQQIPHRQGHAFSMSFPCPSSFLIGQIRRRNEVDSRHRRRPQSPYTHPHTLPSATGLPRTPFHQPPPALDCLIQTHRIRYPKPSAVSRCKYGTRKAPQRGS